jgi:hypothetical protein
MSQAMYALHTSQLFCIPTNPGAAADYTHSIVAGQPPDLTPLTKSKQMSTDMKFNCRMHYFLLMQNIKQACFNTLDSSINDAFKVWNKPAMQGGHAGMTMHDILDQLSSICSQPALTALELNKITFCGPYSLADTPKVLFCRIKTCAKIAILDNNPYTDRHLINYAIRLLLTTDLHQRPFEEWDRLPDQVVFQHHLNVTAPTAGHHGFALAQPFQQKAFGLFAGEDDDNNDSITALVATQVGALTYEGQLINCSQHKPTPTATNGTDCSCPRRHTQHSAPCHCTVKRVNI